MFQLPGVINCYVMDSKDLRTLNLQKNLIYTFGFTCRRKCKEEEIISQIMREKKRLFFFWSKLQAVTLK